jgi:nucleotide-binding universal stress UspA family protein
MAALDERDHALAGVMRTLAARGAEHFLVLHARSPGRTPPNAEARLTALGAAVGAAVRLVDGPPASAVAQVLDAERSDLLLIGRRAALPDRPAWGPNGRAILRAAGCPVLVVPGDTDSVSLASALVGMDLSEEAIEALARCTRMCSSVEALAVLAPEGPDARPDAVLGGLRDQLAAALVARGLPPVPLRASVQGAPADVLLSASEQHDLVAVGSRGLSPLASALLGSTAERLAGRSRRPVLVVRRRGEAKGILGALFG